MSIQSLISNYGFMKAANTQKKYAIVEILWTWTELELALTFKNCLRLDIVLTVPGDSPSFVK